MLEAHPLRGGSRSRRILGRGQGSARGKSDFYTIELSVLSLGSVTGPATTKIQIAQAAIKGSIFYNTYRSNLIGRRRAHAMPGGIPGSLAAGFPRRRGSAAATGSWCAFPPVVAPKCSARQTATVVTRSRPTVRFCSHSPFLNGAYGYELMSNGPAPAPKMAGGSATWAAVYPDGSAFLTMSTAIDVARSSIFGGLSGGSGNATVIDAMTGQPIQSVGIPPGAVMPFFSPDGTYLVFNDVRRLKTHTALG